MNKRDELVKAQYAASEVWDAAYKAWDAAYKALRDAYKAQDAANNALEEYDIDHEKETGQ